MEVKYRLKSNKDFQTLIFRRIFFKTKEIKVVYSVNECNHLRLGVVASKKNGNAVVRNRIKRQLRSMASDVFEKNEPLDIALIALNNYDSDHYNENLSHLKEVAQKIRRKNNEE